MLNDTFRYTKTIAHQDPLHHNQDQVDSFDAVDVHSFDDRRQLYLHGMCHHFQTGEGVRLQNPPWEENSAPWSEPNDSKLKDTYKSNAAIILERDREGSVHSVYNLPLTNAFTIPQLMTRAQDIYERQQYAFLLNLEFGLILGHTETGEYRYFKPV